MYNNEKVKDIFGSLSIDKTRLPSSGLTALGVPSYVAEWLLDKIVPGSGALTAEESAKVNDFVKKAFPRKDDRQEILFDITQKGDVRKIIALMQVRVKLEQGKGLIPDSLAQIPVLNLSDCRISLNLIDQNKMLLRHGVWGKITLGMQPDGDGKFHFEVMDFDPFQCSSVDLDEYAQYRLKFTTDEWRDLLCCSMGLNPDHPNYTREAKTWVLARLLPLVESNYHAMELAPKGTGKSFVFENISSKVSLVSGGKITPAQLFFNGKTKEVGLLGRHDVVALDEVQSLTFDNPDEMIGPLKTYLANGRYNRSGFQDIASDCSLIMLANIELDQYLQPRHEDNLITDLPKFFAETAFLDRFAGIIPGWKIPKFQRDMMASQVGLKMDFFGEVLLALRRDNRYFLYAQQHTKFDQTTFIRDQTAVLKSAAGFLKILYPKLEQVTLMDFQRDCLEPAIELRQAIRNSLYFLDGEFRQRGRAIYAEVQ